MSFYTAIEPAALVLKRRSTDASQNVENCTDGSGVQEAGDNKHLKRVKRVKWRNVL